MTLAGWLSLLVIWSGVSAAGLLLSVMLTNPLALGPLGVTLWFVVLFLGLAAVFCLGFYGVKAFLRLHTTGLGRLRYAWRQGLLVSGWVTGVLALSSVRQLGWLDAILLALLLIIVEVYVRFRWP